MKLRPYQQKAVDSFFYYCRTRKGNSVICAPTGSGKSLILSEVCRLVLEKKPHYRIIVATHRKELIEQNARHLYELLKIPIGVYSAGLGSRTVRSVTCAGIQSIYKKQLDAIQLLIIDECFTGDTLISTPNGLRRIDEMRCGDIVYNAIGAGIVESKSSRSANKLLEIEFSDGKKIICTQNHPFFTETGWLEARQLVIGAVSYGAEAVRLLWERNSALEKNAGKRKEDLPGRKKLEKDSFLLNLLCQEIREPHEQARFSNENESNSQTDSPSAYKAWRQRAIITLATAGSASCAGGGVGSRGGDSHKDSKRKRVSNLLQNRPGESGEKDRHRDRRRLPHNTGKKIAGCQENEAINFVRVVNISNYEPEGAGAVYNLQVSGHPSYFANDKLVHNCHLLSPDEGSMYQKFITQLRSVNPALKILGLSATPYRTDQGSLIGPESIFTDICYDIGIKELIAGEFLSPVISKVNTEAVDFSDVRKSGADYAQKELENKMLPLSVAHCQEIARVVDRKKILVFCSGISHAVSVAASLCRLGVEAAAVHSEMLPMERDQLLENFQSGTLKALCNVSILTTGFDFPALDAIVLLRATKSASLYVQMVGRGMRTAAGKENCLVLDFGGNILRHGCIDQIKVRQKGNTVLITHAPEKECSACHVVVPIATKVCPACGYQFPPASCKVTQRPEDSPIISQPEKLTVDSVEYKVHRKGNLPENPPMLRVNYRCGLRLISEFLCFEHAGYASLVAARKWVQLGGKVPAPLETREAFNRQAELVRASEIEVKKEGKYYRLTKITATEEEDVDLIPDLNI